jgi:predicted ATPase
VPGWVARWTTSIDDGSRFVIIGGDAGVGKTTVVEAFVADLFGVLADRKAQLIRGQCVPMGDEGLPYAPIVGALRDLVSPTRSGTNPGVGRRLVGRRLGCCCPP